MSQNNPSTKTKTPRGWGEQREELFVASNYTTNYQLNQWEAGDQVLRTEFNRDNQKIDTALAGLAAQNEALEAAVSAKGNCTLDVTTYTGTGGYGETTPCSITFNAVPTLVLVVDPEGRCMFFHGGSTNAYNENGLCPVTWAGTTLSWYSRRNSTGQFNESGKLYRVFSFR